MLLDAPVSRVLSFTILLISAEIMIGIFAIAFVVDLQG